MSSFSRLIRFLSTENAEPYFADLGKGNLNLPSPGAHITGFISFQDLADNKNGKTVTFEKLLAPLPRTGLPIYCVGLNYKSHAEEANLPVPVNPPLWVKPELSLANPNEDIPLNDFCAKSLPDYEGELVFVTSNTCRDLTPEQASSHILGFTAGNDISCRLYQLREQSGGQFYYAKAFDKFAPLGPVLVSPEEFKFGLGNAVKLKTLVNGEVVQDADIEKDLIWSPEKILSWMCQGTTIPAFTAVMTGTPAGVGAFKKPRQFLKDGDVVEINIDKIGTLKNRIVFQ